MFTDATRGWNFLWEKDPVLKKNQYFFWFKTWTLKSDIRQGFSATAKFVTVIACQGLSLVK